MLLQFFSAFFATVGFCILFNIPKNAIIKSSLAGAAGWIAFMCTNMQFQSMAFASFIGASVVAIISEIFARKFKEAVTVFVIPGILPLVPGAGMYHTMLAIIEKNFTKSALVGTETLFMAGSIATAILIVSSTTRMITRTHSQVKNKT